MNITELMPSHHPVVIAVSGGPDSMALAHYLFHKHPARVVALSVDHGLRPESVDEACQVHQWLTQWGMEHHTLTWEGVKPGSRVQERAREARYALLGQWCLDHGIQYLATAHHELDQAETVLMRLMKGSGLQGLAGVEAISERPWGMLVRPLLTCSRQEILEYNVKHAVPSLQDPSNQNDKYERVRWRKTLTNGKSHGLTPQSLIELQQEMRRLADVMTLDMGLMERQTDGSLHIPYDLMALSKAIREVGGNPYPPAVSSLAGVFTCLTQGKARTLGGCLLRPRKTHIKVMRENIRRTV